MRVIIFDFDGTIADSFETVLRISNQLAAEFGYPVVQGAEEIDQLKALSSREIIKRSKISPLKLPFLLLRLRTELNREISQLKLISGMKSVLLSLKAQGNRLGIVTSNSCKNVNTFLEVQELQDVFDFVSSGLSLFGKGRVVQRLMHQRRLHPTEVIYVGDETRDIEAAHKIGIKAIAVTWGFNSSQALAAENPDFLIHKPEDLLQVTRTF
ncbi:MAG: HAD hydrolase-like protein [Leptolyngbyaceae cyanobacterium bins.302]|nr:HAD hydrolase-like protein [Leptolyngbyaceae cyanobacterium bins.302]